MKKVIMLGVMFVLMLFTSALPVWSDNPRIAVVSEGNTSVSTVGTVAARGSYFLIFDSKGAFIEAQANPYKNAGGNAGKLVVDYLSAKGATTIIAGDFGDKMIAAIKAKRIHYLIFKGFAEDAVKKAIQ